MTRDEVQAHLEKANVQSEWEDILTKSLCTALIESMDRVEALTKFFVADEAVHEAQRSMFDSVIDGEVPKETRRGIVELCLRRSAARQIARKSLGGSNER